MPFISKKKLAQLELSKDSYREGYEMLRDAHLEVVEALVRAGTASWYTGHNPYRASMNAVQGKTFCGKDHVNRVQGECLKIIADLVDKAWDKDTGRYHQPLSYKEKARIQKESIRSLKEKLEAPCPHCSTKGERIRDLEGDREDFVKMVNDLSQQIEDMKAEKKRLLQAEKDAELQAHCPVGSVAKMGDDLLMVHKIPCGAYVQVFVKTMGKRESFFTRDQDITRELAMALEWKS